MEGTLYSRYEVIESLQWSPGEFADEAFKARESAAEGQPARTRTVMMRRLPDAADTPGVYDAIIRASRLPAHPSILATYGVIETPGEPGYPNDFFIISEYARGILLSERIKRIAPFSVQISIDIAIALAEALAFAEASGLDTHDVRPQDIVCTPEGDIRVADIELGHAIRTSGRPVMTYISGAACVGGLIYHMLTAKSPLDTPEMPTLRGTQTPQPIQALVDRAMAGSYASITEVTAELMSIRSELRGSASIVSRPQSSRPLPAAPYLAQTTTSPNVDQTRFRPVANGNTVRESVEVERGKTVAEAKTLEQEPITPLNSQSTTTKPRPTQPKPRSPRREDLDDDYLDGPAPMSVARKVAMVLGGMVATGVIAFAVYVASLVSNVPNDITVPSLIGQQFTDASAKESQEHIHLVEAAHNFSDTWPQGAIYLQDPPAGRMIKSDKDVDVTVSDGPRLMPVPDLSQMTLKRAEGTLQDSGLPVGAINYTYDDATPDGIVMTQTPAAGANIARTTQISLTVSKGPPPPIAPTDLTATCSVAGEIDLSWTASTSTNTYDVYRDGEKIATQIPETAYSDVALDGDTVHTYTVTAVNSNGESSKSAPAKASADPNATLTNPMTPADTVAQPVDSQSSVSDAPGTPKERQFRVQFRVPNTGTTHKIQIDVQDTTGTSEVYDEEMYGGDTVDKSFQAFGNRVIFRIFIDGKLVRQEPK